MLAGRLLGLGLRRRGSRRRRRLPRLRRRTALHAWDMPAADAAGAGAGDGREDTRPPRRQLASLGCGASNTPCQVGAGLAGGRAPGGPQVPGGRPAHLRLRTELVRRSRRKLVPSKIATQSRPSRLGSLHPWNWTGALPDVLGSASDTCVTAATGQRSGGTAVGRRRARAAAAGDWPCSPLALGIVRPQMATHMPCAISAHPLGARLNLHFASADV